MESQCLLWLCSVFVLIDVAFELSVARPTSERKNSTRIKPTRDFFGIEQPIVFPDEYSEKIEILPRLDGPPKCADSSLTFCEDFDSYPHKEVQQILEENQVPKFFFGVDEPPIEITDRLGERDTFMCDSVSRTIFPKIGTNKNNKWKLIVNQDEEEGFVQAVRIEVCKRPNRRCNVIGDLPVGYTTSCKQKYVYRRLISLDDTGKPVPDTFKLPSACCCAYNIDYNFLSRMGKDRLFNQVGKNDPENKRDD